MLEEMQNNKLSSAYKQCIKMETVVRKMTRHLRKFCHFTARVLEPSKMEATFFNSPEQHSGRAIVLPLALTFTNVKSFR